MVEVLTRFLVSYGIFEGGFDNLLNQWESLGVFSFLLPFLLIFSLVFGILSRLTLFGKESKKINAVVSLAVGLIALQTGLVSSFFTNIFPRLGVALAGILVFVILLGLFGDANNRGLLNTLMWGSFGVGVLIVLQSTEMFGGGLNNIFALIPTWLIPLIVLIVLIAIITHQKNPDKPDIISAMKKAWEKE